MAVREGEAGKRAQDGSTMTPLPTSPQHPRRRLPKDCGSISSRTLRISRRPAKSSSRAYCISTPNDAWALVAGKK